MRNNSIFKHFSAFALFAALLIICAAPVSAEGADGADAIAITVIVPPVSDRAAPTPAPEARRVFPVNVSEGYNYEGVRELVRVYELLSDENPDWINTDGFTRNGYTYQIADIVRRADVAHTVREHTEYVEVNSATNDLAGVIAGLDPTLDFVDEDGYVGVLHLDIRSIEMTQDGTRSTSRTVSQTREYPHLSNPDMSLIPQTVTANGRTYTLADVDWRTNTTDSIDFNSIAQTFTAYATYTRTATSTVSTGYTTRAEYSGTLTRVSTGEVRYVATFIGTPLISPTVNRPAEGMEITDAPYITTEIGIICAEETAVDAELVYGICISGETESTISETETVKEIEVCDNVQPRELPLLPFMLAIPLFAIIALLVILLICSKKKADVLQNRVYSDSANSLNSRMGQIVHRDRAELAEAGEEISDGGSV